LAGASSAVTWARGGTLLLRATEKQKSAEFVLKKNNVTQKQLFTWRLITLLFGSQGR
jgi:hypothetical protein